ncbi:MAG TPA: hypothetical protein DC017_16650 [Candidatus Wallbacteria bacterium]|nr:hypothetical protein [Candidatus Wallbacteria bacterium]
MKKVWNEPAAAIRRGILAAVFILVFVSCIACRFPAAAKEDGRSSDYTGLKSAIDSALSRPSEREVITGIKEACAGLDSIEAELTAFEIFFIIQKREECPKRFSEFEKLLETAGDEYLKSYYSQLALLYSSFVNHALGSEVLTAKERAVAPAHKIELTGLLRYKYLASIEAAKKDAAARKTSADFISYLEKKCGWREDGVASGGSETGEKIAAAFKTAASDGRLMKLIGRRYLLTLMVYKSVSSYGDAQSKKKAAKLVKDNFPRKLFEICFPAGISE